MTLLGGTTGTVTSPVNNLTDLYPRLRLRIGDINPATYRYTDAWLLIALQASVDTLGKWMNYKYILNSSGEIQRNANSNAFIFDEATYGIVEPSDKEIIVTMAAIIVLEGSLENSAWDFASWRDAEISYSNLESSRARGGTLERLWNELLNNIKPPMKRLARAKKSELPGFKDNQYEYVKND